MGRSSGKTGKSKKLKNPMRRGRNGPLKAEGDESDDTPCQQLESEQRKRREELGLPEPEPTFKVVDAVPTSPDLLRLQKLDHERRVRLLSDDD